MGVKPEGKIPLRQNSELLDQEGRLVGRVTSGSYGPSAGHPVAMASIQCKEALEGNRLFTKIRNKDIAVNVVSLPFIPHRYHRRKKP